jgi:hypothetical protein
MMRKFRLIIVLLVFALLIQNTCPFGAAGRTTVAAAGDHCCLKYSISMPADGREKIGSAVSPVHYPLYVFSVPKTIHTFHLASLQSARPLLSDNYQNALPDELLRPPRV